MNQAPKLVLDYVQLFSKWSDTFFTVFCLCRGTSLTLGAHVQRGLQYLVCVCVSVTQHLTLHMFIRATNDTNLLSGG